MPVTATQKLDPLGLRKGGEKLQHFLLDYEESFSETTTVQGDAMSKDIEDALRLSVHHGHGYELWHPDPLLPAQVLKDNSKNLGIPGRIMPRREVYAVNVHDKCYELYMNLYFLLNDSVFHNLEHWPPKLCSLGWVFW